MKCRGKPGGECILFVMQRPNHFAEDGDHAVWTMLVKTDRKTYWAGHHSRNRLIHLMNTYPIKVEFFSQHDGFNIAVYREEKDNG